MLENRLPFLLSLVLLFCLWKEVQGRCSSCPNNGCPQTGMSQGKCYRARYYTTSYKTSYYVTTYYQGTSQGSSTYRCGGWWRRRRCTRYHTNYHQASLSSVRYRTAYRSNRACDAYCCPGYKKDSNGRCIVSCGIPSFLSNGQRRYSSTTVRSTVTYTCNTGYLRTAGNSSRTLICGTPSSLSNGQRGRYSTTVGSTVTYTCNTGYRMTAGSSSRTCQSNHQWSGSHPTCTRNSNGNILLIGGPTAQQGRVEIWYNSRWNTICDNSWDINDANVVCQQLGYQGAITAHQSAHFGQGSGQILLDDLQCTGREASLLECSHRGISNHNCGHNEDASVTCKASRFSSGFLRLANGYAPSAGRVEIWYSNQWNTVCHNNWGITDARVACRQLGYEGAALAHRRAHFGQGSGGILLNGLFCTGTEGSLFQCQHDGIYSNNCWHGEDAGVTCGCGDPGTFNGITPIASGTAVNSTVTYSCQSGYILSGSSTRTYQPNGHWNGSVPTCIRQCSEEDQP